MGFLLKQYSEMKKKEMEGKEEPIEPWISTGLDEGLRRSIQNRLNRSLTLFSHSTFSLSSPPPLFISLLYPSFFVLFRLSFSHSTRIEQGCQG